MLKKFLSSFLIIFLFNTAYIPYIPPRDLIRRKKIEYIFESDDEDENFIFLKDKTVVLIHLKFLPFEIKEFVLNKN